MPYDEDGYSIRPNKTAIKRELQLLRNMGKEMIALSDELLEELPVGDKLKGEVRNARRMKKQALRRQLVYLEKLLRDEDAEALREALDKLDQPHQQEVRFLHQLEQWRERLLDNDNALMEELLQEYPMLERQQIRQLVRNAQKEKQQNKPPKSFRALFQYLQEHTGADED